ncbi:MAG: VCBS repeat-containing protein [Bacteroidota bacterium]
MVSPGPSPEPDPPLWGVHRSQRVAVGLFALHFLWAVTSWSQRSSYFFGQCTDHPIGLEVRDLAVVPRTAGQMGEIALLPSAESYLLLFVLDSTGSVARVDTCDLPAGQRQIVAADLDGDGRNQFVSFNSEKGVISILKRAGNGFSEQSIAAVPARHLSIADINSDGRPDILLYGRTSAGVITYLNRRNGRFVRGPVLFPDISVSDLQVRDLDGDGVNDVFLLDWLSNKLDVFYGISRMIFSEQLSVDLPGEPGALAVGPVTAKRTTRIGITFPSMKKIIVYDGNALGDFSIGTIIECPSSPGGILIEDIDKDGLSEVVTSTDHGILVRGGAPASSVERTQFFAPPAGPNLWALATVRGDGYPDLVVMDRRTRTLRILFNEAHTPAVEPVQSYAVGVDPLGVAIGDVDGDGLQDVLVANEGSNTISTLLNRGDGLLHSQQSVLAGDAPSWVSRLAGGIEGMVVAHSASGRVRIVTLGGEKRYSSVVTMPAGERPEILEASFNPEDHRIEIMLRSFEDEGRRVTLTFLQQLSRRQFLERTFHPLVSSPVLAVSAIHLGPRRDLAVLFATNNAHSKRTTVYSVRATPTFQFGPVNSLFSFPDSTSRTFLLLWGEQRSETSSTAAVAIGEPVNSIGAFAIEGDTLARPVHWVGGIRPIDDTALAFEDVDGDGIPDLVVADALQKMVVFLRGLPGGAFAEPEGIAPAGNIGAFAVGRLTRSQGDDLIFTDRRQGTLRLLIDPFRRKGE